MSTVTRHFYVRDSFGHGLATVAYRQSFSRDKMTVEYGTSFCHPSDAFDRMEGRNRAIERMKNKIVLPEKLSANEVIHVLLKKILRSSPNCPRRVRKAVKERLRQVERRPREVNGNRRPASL